MKFISSILFSLILFAVNSLTAQDPGLEYFAKVPSKYKVPGLSPMKVFQISYLNIPSSLWVKNTVEMHSDLFRVKMNYRLSIIFSTGLYSGAKRQVHELYTINDKTAKERVNYFILSPIASISGSFAFSYPYFLRAGGGINSNFERANYKATIPEQVSGKDGIETNVFTYTLIKKQNNGIKPYLFIEIYRPFKSKPNNKRRLGYTIGVFYWPENTKTKKTSLNVGIYWNAK